MTEQDQNQETETGSDLENINWETLIVLQRHGAYDNRAPSDKLSEEELNKLGWLTSEGEINSRKSARDRIEKILDKSRGKPVDFIVLNSPSLWMRKHGARAKQTAEIIAEEAKGIIEKRGLSRDRACFLEFGKSEAGTRPHNSLRTADITYLNNRNPRVFIDALKKEAKGGDWLEIYANQELRKLQEKTGAESPVAVGDRVRSLVNVLEKFARGYHSKYPERKLVIWMVSHGEVIRSYVQHFLDLDPHFVNGYNPKPDEPIDLWYGPETE